MRSTATSLWTRPAATRRIDRVVRVCPAALYKKDGDGVRFDYLGCLECGTCRVLSGGKLVESWNYPVGAFGMSFRQG